MRIQRYLHKVHLSDFRVILLGSSRAKSILINFREDEATTMAEVEEPMNVETAEEVVEVQEVGFISDLAR